MVTNFPKANVQVRVAGVRQFTTCWCVFLVTLTLGKTLFMPLKETERCATAGTDALNKAHDWV